jgi:hypothetical protein
MWANLLGSHGSEEVQSGDASPTPAGPLTQTEYSLFDLAVYFPIRYGINNNR